jgi:hypothetical protein
MMREGNIFLFGKDEVGVIKPHRESEISFSYKHHVGLMTNYGQVGPVHWVTVETLFSRGVRWFKVLNAECPKVIRHCLLPGSKNEVAMIYDDFVLLKLST